MGTKSRRELQAAGEMDALSRVLMVLHICGKGATPGRANADLDLGVALRVSVYLPAGSRGIPDTLVSLRACPQPRPAGPRLPRHRPA